MSGMALLALIANLIFTAACLIVGSRLLLLARRTRQLPELLIGTSFVAAGIAMVLLLILPSMDRETALTRALIHSTRLLIAVTMITVLIMAWRVFRPTAQWARAVVVVNSVLVLGTLFIDALRGPDGDLYGNPLYWLIQLGEIFPYAWASTEAYLYQRDLRRRQRVGLAPAGLLATRMALWSIGMGVSAMLWGWSALVVAMREFFGVHLPYLFATSALGMIVAVSLWLAFFPPASWRRAAAVAQEGAA